MYPLQTRGRGLRKPFGRHAELAERTDDFGYVLRSRFKHKNDPRPLIGIYLMKAKGVFRPVSKIALCALDHPLRDFAGKCGEHGSGGGAQPLAAFA